MAANIEKFIALLHRSSRYIESIFMEGGCYQFSRILINLFGGKTVMHSSGGHVGTLIDGVVYDITGAVDKNDFKEMTEEDLKRAVGWDFDKNMFLAVKECPHCDEVIIMDEFLEED